MLLSDAEIRDIYDRHIAVNYTGEYADKYVPLPLRYNNKKWKWEGKDFPRVIALLEFREYMLGCDRTFDAALSINGDKDPEWEYLRHNKPSFNYNYMDNVEKHDLHNLELPQWGFDFVMANQTIEHLYDPILAIKNIYKHMKVGGVFYANVPVNSIPHDTPFHYYTGVTPVGLGAVVKLAGFDILKIGQWGNASYYAQSIKHKWPDYKHMQQVADNRAGYNDFDCPAITWCFAIKNK
jgi:SAM-dependent methyltransferase